MKLAFLILCHKNSEQINKLMEALSHPNIYFYVHVDRKSEITQQINTHNSNVTILPEEERVDVKWGTFSQVEATLNLLKQAYSKKYDYYWLISGQDFPLVSAKDIITQLSNAKLGGYNFVNLFVSKNNGAKKSTNFDKRNEIIFPEWLLKHDFKHRIVRRLWVEITGGYQHTFCVFLRPNMNELKYYFGSQWWCINCDFVSYILDYIESHPEYISFFKKASCPDESFFQTLLMNSDFAFSRREYLHYIDWSEGTSSPKTLKCTDLDKAFASHKLIARKIDQEYDKEIITEIIKRINDHNT